MEYNFDNSTLSVKSDELHINLRQKKDVYNNTDFNNVSEAIEWLKTHCKKTFGHTIIQLHIENDELIIDTKLDMELKVLIDEEPKNITFINGVCSMVGLIDEDKSINDIEFSILDNPIEINDQEYIVTHNRNFDKNTT